MNQADLERAAIEGTIPSINIEPSPNLPEPTPAAASPVGAATPRAPFITKERIKTLVYSRWFRYMLLFVVITVLLLIIAPPFVQQRRKNQSALEKAPTSYKRVLIAATVTTGLVVVAPLLITHKAKFLSVAGVVKKWF
jgi:hypothetical protein